MLLNLLQRNVHFSTIKDTGEGGISQHALDSLARVFKVGRKKLAARAALPLTAVSFNGNSVEAEFTDLLAAV